ncbi:MAG TPA: helix-turn-helix transcriptional regulator [Candidatus Fimimorpha excrementavium]|nr:helix-turn-helix transcriptional regulator [Candidatus Fimimorpha excrementavium]
MCHDSFILQSQLNEVTINLERVHHAKCDASRWKGDHLTPAFSSIGLILDGTGTIICDDIQLHPTKGQLYLLPSHTTQSFYTSSKHPYEKYFCHLHVQSHGASFFEFIHTPLCVDAGDLSTAVNLFEKMIQYSGQTTISSLLKVKQYTLELLIYFLECCPSGSVTLVENSFDIPLKKALTYAEKDHYQSVTVGMMAEVAGYHPSYFSKLFSKKLGITPAQFIIRKKTDLAIEQLLNTNRSISHIAEDLGFNSQFYFHNFFKKQTGLSPSEYRNLYKKISQ